MTSQSKQCQHCRASKVDIISALYGSVCWRCYHQIVKRRTPPKIITRPYVIGIVSLWGAAFSWMYAVASPYFPKMTYGTTSAYTVPIAWAVTLILVGLGLKELERSWFLGNATDDFKRKSPFESPWEYDFTFEPEDI